MTIEVNNISFSFESNNNRHIPIFSSFSLMTGDKSFISIVGPSGCGKSTLLRILAGLLVPDKGSVRIFDIDPQKLRISGKVGFVFQSPSLLPWRTVFDNVRLSFELNSGSFSLDLVNDIIAEVGLASWMHNYPHELSGGMQQRVALARALVAHPELLLLDEPFSQLDEILRFDLLFMIQKLSEIYGTTVVLVTHDISEAVIFSDTVYVLGQSPNNRATIINVDIEKKRSIESTNLPAFYNAVSSIRSILEKFRNKDYDLC